MLDNQLFVKTAHNRVIYTKETARLKKNDSQTAFCKILLRDKSDVQSAKAGRHS